ncbi:MAG: hypothetical protein JOZ46_09180 [Candidatus Dormibacteraeota bacterium]|nr:hypothetical protein [Candidatus Dormibacteraeota bacterium]MBV9525970.1 hypothetical protein [Candidatus Dormibacteraeota bacterium]
MPMPASVHPGTRRSVRGLLGRVLHRPAPCDPGWVEPEPAPAPIVDAHTRTFWGRGDAPSTLVEVEGPPRRAPGARSRLSALLEAHESGRVPQPRPRGNPAFSEALFVELMRARQYRRAFDQLSRDCRERWGSAESFAAAQGGALRWLRGVRVRDVRFLPEWTDEHAGRRYADVAELQVEYAFGDSSDAKLLPRTVHLVPDDGKWRSLCYPA